MIMSSRHTSNFFVAGKMEKSQKEYYLNEQMKALKKELGELDESEEVDLLEEKINKAGMTKEANDKALSELQKYKMMSPMSAEASVVRGYLDWIISIPWKKKSILQKNLNKASDILEEDHHGLEEVKERILEFKPIQERIEQIKERYKKIREQKIKERIESLGIEVLATDSKEDLIQKEKEYAEQRQKIETILESFYRSANSLVFQLNKRYIPKHKSILRVIDRRYEENLCFIRYDDVPDENFLMLIYLEDSNPAKETIVLEDKTNEEKHVTKSFKPNQIFAYSDYLVDQFTAHLDREFKKKKTS